MKILFETSFEVCNLIGGIHRVVASKSKYISREFDKTIFIGPWVESDEFIQAKIKEVPKDIQKIFDILFKQGIKATYGWWNIDSKPEVVLLEYQSFANSARLNNLKTFYWKEFKIDSIYARWDFDEPLLFATFAGIFIEEYIKENTKKQDLCVAQFHEWMSGFGGLYLKKKKEIDDDLKNTKIIYTTHATMLGRVLYSENKDLKYIKDNKLNLLEEAKRIGIIEKHTTELACAKNCDCFTTVSKITQIEAKEIYGIKPEITNNGLDLEELNYMKDIFKMKFKSREVLEKITLKYFPGLNLEKYLFVFTSGRPEFHNKGFDEILQSLQDIQNKGFKVVFFFLVPWSTGNKLDKLDLISTHELYDKQDNSIYQKAKELKIDNSKDTKIILYPIYLGSEEDDLFNNKDYLETISGFDLGIFPSNYEPWGYTSPEALSVGVPAVTSNTSGFGDYCKNKRIKVEIINKSKDSAKQIYNIIKKYSKMDSNDKFVKSLEAIAISKKFSWEEFISQYTKEYFK